MKVLGAFFTLILIGQLNITLCQNSTATTAQPSPNAAIFNDASELPENTDLGTCSCDLTTSACDVNCCCDSDCNSADLQMFSHCINDYGYPEDPRLCSRPSSQTDNPDTTLDDAFVTTSLNPNLFCIWNDNYKSRFYYQIPELAKNELAYQALVETASTSFSYESTPFVPRQSTSKERYYVGQLIYFITNVEFPILKVPTASVSSTSCLDFNAAQFLRDESSTCTRHLPSTLSQYICETFTPLNAELFRSSLQRFNISSVPPSNNGIATPIPITVRGVQTPTYNQSTCFGVLSQVDIAVSHEAGVITSVAAYFMLADISGSPTAIEQKYSITYKAPPTANRTEGDVIKRSGNPGYLIGEPIIAGRINSSGTFIILDSNRDNYLTVLKPNVDESCTSSATSRTPVLFGENIRSGCTLQLSDTISELTTTNCEQFREAARTALLGPTQTINDDGSIYIASLGNSNHLKVGDWVPLLSSKFPVSGCGVSMDLQILYSYIGELHNSQARIIGSRLQFATISLSSQCPNSQCSSKEDKSRRFEVVSSVSFIDVSTEPEPFLAEKPVFTLKLPADFFKPFYSSSAVSNQCNLAILVLLTMCFLY